MTPYFRRHPQAFRVQQLPEHWPGLRPEIRLTVDTREEYEQMAAIFAALGTRGGLFSLQDVYRHCDASRLVTSPESRLRRTLA